MDLVNFLKKNNTYALRSLVFGVFIFQKAEKTGNFYRYMEADVLKHNCIAYLLQDYLNVLGQPFTKGETMPTFEVILGEKLDRYTALAKFMEQAFEWEIMDYTSICKSTAYFFVN